MPAPLIIPSMFSHKAGPENMDNHADPVAIGFAEFADEPQDVREQIIRQLYEYDGGLYIPTANTTQRYVGALADTIEHTVTSTGITQVPVALAYRAVKRHYGYEVQTHISGYAERMLRDTATLSESLGFRGRRKLGRLVADCSLQVGDYNLFSDYDGLNWDRAVARRAGENTAAIDINKPAHLLEGLGLPTDEQIDLATVVTNGLRTLPQRLETEAELFRSARNAITEHYSDFGHRQRAL